MKLIAIRAFPYGGKQIAKGDSFEAVSDQHAKVLIATKRARKAEAAVKTKALAADLPAETRTADQDDDKRRYKRRDLRAES